VRLFSIFPKIHTIGNYFIFGSRCGSAVEWWENKRKSKEPGQPSFYYRF
jgi:hypothetical protein